MRALEVCQQSINVEARVKSRKEKKKKKKERKKRKKQSMNAIPQLRDEPPILGTAIEKTLKSFARVLE